MKISSNSVVKKEIAFDGWPIYRAYFRGTNNRIHYENASRVQGFTHKADLIFAIKNNPMERGVIAYK